MHRSTPWILLVGLWLTGCPEDLADVDELAVERPTPAVPVSTGPPPAAAPVEEATPYTGEDAARMTINSRPWGRIDLDGKRAGNTPKRDFAIAPGTHEITIHCGPCLEEDSVEWTFSVAAGEQYTHLHTEFGESQPVVNQDNRFTDPDPGGGPDLSGGVIQPHKGADAAFLTLNSKPWSYIYMDGMYLGNTPQKRYAVAPGGHHVKLDCVLCAPPQQRELEIDLAAGETYTEVRVEYEP